MSLSWVMAESSRWCSLEQTGVARVTKGLILNDEFKHENKKNSITEIEKQKEYKADGAKSRSPLGKYETAERTKWSHIRRTMVQRLWMCL